MLNSVGVVVSERYWLRKYDGEPLPENLVEVIQIGGDDIAAVLRSEPGKARELWEQIEEEINGAD